MEHEKFVWASWVIPIYFLSIGIGPAIYIYYDQKLIVQERVIPFTNDDVPRFLKQLDEYNEYSKNIYFVVKSKHAA